MAATAFQRLHVRCLLRDLDMPTDRVVSAHAVYLRHAGIPVVLGERLYDTLDAASSEQLRKLAAALLDPAVVPA